MVDDLDGGVDPALLFTPPNHGQLQHPFLAQFHDRNADDDTNTYGNPGQPITFRERVSHMVSQSEGCYREGGA